jgi:hypothetical protein
VGRVWSSSAARGFLAAVLLLCPASAARQQSFPFAVIGDYGGDTAAEADVARLVKSWNPEFILTVGDNNYETGSAATIDVNIGKHYHEFIYRYAGSYGSGSQTQRFLPSLGNHDWGNRFPEPAGADPYLAYFDLPGNERYYEWRTGPVHVFAIDSDVNEPDGTTSASAQALWLQKALAASDAPWKLVYFHHPPYTSGVRGGNLEMRWPFAAWGASAVLAGHDHDYERLSVDGIPYFVDGLGGRSVVRLGPPIAESQVRYDADFGAMLVTATAAEITFRFYTRAGILVDTFSMTASTPSRGTRRPSVVPWRPTP